ncbi:hypothetical protein V8C86DRAFT_2444059 [Haematococcus lacustris]
MARNRQELQEDAGPQEVLVFTSYNKYGNAVIGVNPVRKTITMEHLPKWNMSLMHDYSGVKRIVPELEGAAPSSSLEHSTTMMQISPPTSPHEAWATAQARARTENEAQIWAQAEADADAEEARVRGRARVRTLAKPRIFGLVLRRLGFERRLGFVQRRRFGFVQRRFGFGSLGFVKRRRLGFVQRRRSPNPGPTPNPSLLGLGIGVGLSPNLGLFLSPSPSLPGGRGLMRGVHGGSAL